MQSLEVYFGAWVSIKTNRNPMTYDMLQQARTTPRTRYLENTCTASCTQMPQGFSACHSTHSDLEVEKEDMSIHPLSYGKHSRTTSRCPEQKSGNSDSPSNTQNSSTVESKNGALYRPCPNTICLHPPKP